MGCPRLCHREEGGRVARWGLARKVRTPGPGCRDGGLQHGWAGGTGVPFGLLLLPGLPSLRPSSPSASPYRVAAGHGHSPDLPSPLFLAGPCYALSDRFMGIASLLGARPTQGNLQTSGVHCRDLASCEAGAAASLCLGFGGPVAQKAPETTGYQAAFLRSGDRNQLWLKPSQRESEMGQGGGRPARAGLGRAAWWGRGAAPRGHTCRGTLLESPNCCCVVVFFS